MSGDSFAKQSNNIRGRCQVEHLPIAGQPEIARTTACDAGKTVPISELSLALLAIKCKKISRSQPPLAGNVAPLRSGAGGTLGSKAALLVVPCPPLVMNATVAAAWAAAAWAAMA